MGQPKLLIDIAGQTVIARLITALRVAGVDDILLVGRRNDDALWREVQQHAVHALRPDVDPPDMRTSIEHALRFMREQLAPSDDDCWLLIPADHPVIDPRTIREVCSEWQKTPTQILIPTHNGERGHPTALPWRVASEVFEIPADRGLNWLIRSQPQRVREWPTSNAAVLLDLDTPADLARLTSEFSIASMKTAHTQHEAEIRLVRRTCSPSLPTEDNVRSTDCNSVVPSVNGGLQLDHNISANGCSEAVAGDAAQTSRTNPLRVGGVIVCGGKSTRMGRPKLSLPFGSELMLQRVCRILSTVVDPIVVVAAVGQELPPLPADVLVVRDEYPDQGPLAGIATGLGALRGRADAAYVTSCDVPLLKPEFIRHLIAKLTTHAAVVPCDAEHVHVLAAVYRLELEDLARRLINEQRRRPLFLIEQSDSIRVATSELRSIDPELDSLSNLNTPADYEAALQRAMCTHPRFNDSRTAP